MTAPTINAPSPAPLRETPGTGPCAQRPGTTTDHALDVFLAHRTHLLRLARRVTGDAWFAQDVVQEAWLRWQRVDRAEVKNPAAFLTTTTTRLAVNVLNSAAHRHEAPGGAVLDTLVGRMDDPRAVAETTNAVEGAIGDIMTRLSLPELAAYLLRKAFEYPYAEIASILRLSTPYTRQLVHRAQARIDAGEASHPVDPAAHRRLSWAFIRAARTGEIASLVELLSTEDPAQPGQAALDVPNDHRSPRELTRRVA